MSKLRPDELRTHFEQSGTFTAAEVKAFYQGFGEDLNPNTLLSRIYNLKKKGVIASSRRGTFVLGGRPYLYHFLDDACQEIAQELSVPFPHIRLCIWNTTALDQILETPPSTKRIIIETDKEAAESVFDELSARRSDVFLNPDHVLLQRYVPLHQEPVLIKPLISEAPLDRVKKTTVPSLEKTCVDLLADPDYFTAWQGARLRDFYLGVFRRNVINYSALSRYARRRGRIDALKRLLRQLNLLRSDLTG